MIDWSPGDGWKYGTITLSIIVINSVGDLRCISRDIRQEPFRVVTVLSFFE